jgi:hypothetical protein
MTYEQRLTIVARNAENSTPLEWNDAPDAARVMVFMDAIPFMKLNIVAALAEPTLDTERVILDRTVTAEMYLELLAALPPVFAGDVLLIGPNGGGFLSATGRGGDRVLYALKPGDVAFYLAAHQLVQNVGAGLLLEKSA